MTKLEQAVQKEINRFCAEYLEKDELKENPAFQNHLTTQKKRLEKDIAAYRKKTAAYAKCIRELYFDKVKAVISESEYLDFSKEFTSEKERFETLILKAEKQLANIEIETEIKIQTADNRGQLSESYACLEKLDRETVDKLIDYISVGRRVAGTTNVPVEIHWNF